MPLFEMSANLQELEAGGARKRSHSEFVKEEPGEPGSLENANRLVPLLSSLSDHDKENKVISSTPVGSAAATPHAKCSPGLTESGSSPPDGNSPSPTATPTRAPLAQSSIAHFVSIPISTQNTARMAAIPSTATTSAAATPITTTATKPSTCEAPVKKKRATSAEKAAKDAAEAARKAEAAKTKEEQKAAKEAEKNRKAQEMEQKRREKEEKKEQKRREKEAEEAKKARSQIKLTSMFKMAPSTPKKETAALKIENAEEMSPGGDGQANVTKEKSVYKQTFKPFFVKEHVKLADCLVPDEDTCIAKTRILEEWVDGNRGELPLGRFDPAEACQFLCYPTRRGRVYPSVSKIMAEYHGQAMTTPIDLTTESHNSQIRHTREALRSVPVKSLKFKEDVRPPYIGTISGLPAGVRSLNKIGRNPIRRDVLPLNYEYDSEAEWQEEDGEDVDDLDDDEDEADNDEEMDDFLDDSEDVGPARLLFSGGMEPESTGLCWENQKRLNDTAKMYKFRMEFILESLDHHSGINPFSNEYWAPQLRLKPVAAGNETSNKTTIIPSALSVSPRGSSKITTTSSESRIINPMAPPPVPPADAFQALTPKNSDGAKKPPQLLPADLQEELKFLLRSKPTLSKVGIVELFHSDHKCPRAQIKASFDALTEKVAKGVWKLKQEAEAT
ncbi:chromatin assembly factor 1 subunit A-domain-containing protein [Apodospora peruviana]|uniref:Chromatin assembly factor 1 subunit A-domain-containing protein n=1 Tax=Apodospora peruviana TaxID=516989 RepID=A0AAE0MB20_9PEZI|nr:chromatin assembly factor 1 subunit A-domain-containing protein [Apodospora peruviana]